MDTEVTQFQMEAILGSDTLPFETFISDLMESYDWEAKSMYNMMKHKYPNSVDFNLANFLSSPTKDSKSHALRASLLMKLHAENHLLPFLYRCVNSSSNKLKMSAFTIFAQLAEEIGETMVPCVKDLHSLFLNTLSDDKVDLYVRITAMKAVTSFIQCLSSSNEKERFQDLLPCMMRTLSDALCNSTGEEVAAQRVLVLFIDLAKNEPRFLRTQLVDVVGTVFEIAVEADGLEDRTRQFAVEFFITLVEARERAPGMMKRLPWFISRCFAMLLKLLLDVKDDPAWHSAEVMFDYTGATSNFHVGSNCLRRFSRALGGKSIAYIAKEQLSAYLAAPEWEQRHAALIALAKIAKGCSKVMIKNLEQQVIDMVLNCFQDPHPRVRWAACRAIERLLIEFYPHLQEQFHNQVFPAIAAAMDDFHQRVQVSALRALCSFRVLDNPETWEPYLDGIVNKLLVLLQNDKQNVQLEALNSLGHITNFLEEQHFGTYYDNVMSQLKTILRNTDIKSNLVRARAIDCISIVWMAVGKERFRGDEKQVMEVLMSLQGLQVKGVDPVTTHLLAACARICYCMEKNFLPYMSAIMPFLIQCAQLEPIMTLSVQVHCENNELNDNSLEKVKKRVIHVKAKACDVLCWCAETLEDDFYPWVSQAVSIFVPLLKFNISNPVRKSAVEAMPILLRSAKLAVEKGIAQGRSKSYLKRLSNDIILALVKALYKERVTEICAVMLDKLDDCLQICQLLLNEGQLRIIVDEIKHVIIESSNRKSRLTERTKFEDFDAEEAELLREEYDQEDQMLANVGPVLRTLIRTFKDAFLPFFDELSSYLTPMCGKDKTIQERDTAISILYNVVDTCSGAGLKYCDVFLPLFLDASNDESSKVRENALRGLGFYARYGGSVFKPFAGEAISRIKVVIMHFRACEPENERAYGNAVSALGKICQFHQESIDSSQKKLSSGELLNVEPLELIFPFQLKKRISCSLHLSNKTENHVAFKVKTTNPKKYAVRPNTGIVLPRSTCDVIVTMEAQKEAPPDMQCEDKFLLQSVVAIPDITPKDVTREMFNKEAGRVVDECKLRVIYLSPPQPPSTVAEGLEQGSQRQSMKDNGHQDGSEVLNQIWLNCLPIKGDLDEAKYVHGTLCSIVERLDRELIGPNYQYLPKIISVFAEVLCSEKDLVTEKTANRMINVLRHLQQTLPPDTLELAWSYLLPRQEMELKSLVSPEEDVNF